MIAVVADLQKALFEVLSGDGALLALLGGAKVFDSVPANAAFPYIAFGRSSIFDWSTATENGAEQLFTLHIWSKARGRKEVLNIMDAVQKRFDQVPLDLDEHRLVNLRFEFADIRYDDDQSVNHGLLRFRAVTEPAI